MMNVVIGCHLLDYKSYFFLTLNEIHITINSFGNIVQLLLDILHSQIHRLYGDL